MTWTGRASGRGPALEAVRRSMELANVTSDSQGHKRDSNVLNTSEQTKDGQRSKRQKQDVKLARQLQEKHRMGAVTAQEYRAAVGEDASPSATVKSDVGLSYADVQRLLQFIFAKGPPPTNRWAVQHAPLIRNAVVVMCCGVSMALYEEKPWIMQQTAECMGKPVEMLTRKSPCTVSSDWFTHALFNVSPTREQSKDVKARLERMRFPKPIDFYVASLDQLRKNQFPLPNEDGTLPEGFLCTESTGGAKAGARAKKGPGSSGPTHRIVACDCEMVRCASGLALARLTLMGEKGQVLLDEFVRPDEPILDYNTRWSGITAKEMAAAKMGLEEARKRVMAIVSAETVLVGHSLENDLRCMRIVHTRVIDTSLLYPHREKDRKNALRTLTSRFLRRNIQQSDKGHSSVEDARAALDLALKKIEYGPDYGMPGMDDSKLSLATLLEEGGAELTIIDSAENLSRYRGKFLAESRAKGVECTDDKLVGRAIREALGDAGALDRAPQVVWAQIGRVFETHVQQSEERVDMEAGTVAPLGQERHDKLCRRVARVDARLAKVWENAPAGTLVLVMTCAGNTPLVSRMARIRETTKGKGMDGHVPFAWSMDLEAMLDAENAAAQRGMLFCRVKQ